MLHVIDQLRSGLFGKYLQPSELQKYGEMAVSSGHSGYRLL